MKEAFLLFVKTGDQKGAGTDANVSVTLEDERGVSTPAVKLDKRFHNDLERSRVDTYSVECSDDFGRAHRMKIARDTVGFAHDWFCDYIHVADRRLVTRKSSRGQSIVSNSSNKSTKSAKRLQLGRFSLRDISSDETKDIFFFPIHRWISADHEYLFHEFAVCLPQLDATADVRKRDLQSKREIYKYIVHQPGLMPQIKDLPRDEQFSDRYFWTFAKSKTKLRLQTKVISWITGKWNSLEDLTNVYLLDFEKPECTKFWKEDWWFGAQRLQGVNPLVIKLCKMIPENLDVTEDTVEGLLEDMTLSEALEMNKIFICDLAILDGLKCKDNREVATPLALFYLNKNNEMMPVAIQLKQARGADNPVYTPKDEPNTWLVAKMFYNNAEAQHHQALTHLGYTHLLMEGVVICTHRNLSPSHPLFKLMAPHFLFLLAINTRGLEKLICPGGWVDRCMTQGVEGIFQLMERGFDKWRFDVEGQILTELQSRGVLDKEILPEYPYRDDAIAICDVIKEYVRTVVNHHYDTDEKFHGDSELKCWRQELAKPMEHNGLGLQNIPGNENGFTCVDEVIDLVTAIISTCSISHAIASQQYEQYSFVPNYPAMLLKEVPKEKISYTEQDIMAMLPDKKKALAIMVITKLLSMKGTNNLGNFEKQYMYDPAGVRAVEQFKRNLDGLNNQFRDRNSTRKWKFEWLNPETVPNSISV